MGGEGIKAENGLAQIRNEIGVAPESRDTPSHAKSPPVVHVAVRISSHLQESGVIHPSFGGVEWP